MTIHSSINRYDNITVHSFDIKIHTGDAVRQIERVNYKDVVIFSAMNLVYATQLKVYN